MQQRGRQCVSVKAGRQGELPKGSVKLGASKTGATFYMEPAPLIDLNNADARLTSQERRVEEKVLCRLSASVAASSAQILQVSFLHGKLGNMMHLSGYYHDLKPGREQGWQIYEFQDIISRQSLQNYPLLGKAGGVRGGRWWKPLL